MTLAQTVLIGFLLAWLYSNMSQTSPGAIADETGILFFVTIFTGRRRGKGEREWRDGEGRV